MKIILVIALFALTTMTSSTPVAKQDTVVNNSVALNEDFLKKELQQSVMEFCEDTGTNPDSVYMPFRDSL